MGAVVSTVTAGATAMANKPVVRVIEATKPLYETNERPENEKCRVAAYARVSTLLDAQQNSFDTQVEYFTNLINSKPEWELVKVYADDGISGGSRKKRTGFNQMMADAMDNKIDVIMAKSITRFGRNKAETSQAIQDLMEHGVRVIFENNNIDTFDKNSNFAIGIYSTLAEEEIHNMSNSIKWAKQIAMQNGKVYMPYSRFLGYKRGADGSPEIDEEQAVLVRRIYKMFLDGKGYAEIARTLNSEEIPTPSGKENWCGSVVKSILANEKYSGNAILQKTFTVDFRTKKSRKNTGQLPIYNVKDSHPAIIDNETYELVQEEIKRRTRRKRYSSPFCKKIICAECGEHYGHKIWNSRDRNLYDIWACNGKLHGRALREKTECCKTACVREEVIKAAFLLAANPIIEDLENFREQCERARIEDNRNMLRAEREQLALKRSEHLNFIDTLQREYAGTATDEKTNKYSDLLNDAEDKIARIERRTEKINEQLSNDTNSAVRIATMLDALHKHHAPLKDFDDELWTAMVKVLVVSEARLEFHFYGGMVVSILIDDAKEVAKYEHKKVEH